MTNNNFALMELFSFAKKGLLTARCQFSEELIFWTMANYNLDSARKAISNYQAKISNNAISIDIILNLKTTLTDLQSTTDEILLKVEPTELTNNISLSQVIRDLSDSIRLVPRATTEKVTESGITRDVIITILIPQIRATAQTNSDVEDLVYQLEAFNKIANNHVNDILTSDDFRDMLGQCADDTVMELQAS